MSHKRHMSESDDDEHGGDEQGDYAQSGEDAGLRAAPAVERVGDERDGGRPVSKLRRAAEYLRAVWEGGTLWPPVPPAALSTPETPTPWEALHRELQHLELIPIDATPDTLHNWLGRIIHQKAHVPYLQQGIEALFHHLGAATACREVARHLNSHITRLHILRPSPFMAENVEHVLHVTSVSARDALLRRWRSGSDRAQGVRGALIHLIGVLLSGQSFRSQHYTHKACEYIGDIVESAAVHAGDGEDALKKDALTEEALTHVLWPIRIYTRRPGESWPASLCVNLLRLCGQRVHRPALFTEPTDLGTLTRVEIARYQNADLFAYIEATTITLARKERKYRTSVGGRCGRWMYFEADAVLALVQPPPPPDPHPENLVIIPALQRHRYFARRLAMELVTCARTGVPSTAIQALVRYSNWRKIVEAIAAYQPEGPRYAVSWLDDTTRPVPTSDTLKKCGDICGGRLYHGSVPICYM